MKNPQNPKGRSKPFVGNIPISIPRIFSPMTLGILGFNLSAEQRQQCISEARDAYMELRENGFPCDNPSRPFSNGWKSKCAA